MQTAMQRPKRALSVALMAPLNAILWGLRKLNTTVNLGNRIKYHVQTHRQREKKYGMI